MNFARMTKPAESVPTADLLENSARCETAARPVVLFVLGIGRSGTSALTRVLSLCGATLPAAMRSADSTNPRGYWEPRASLIINEGILRRHDSAWYDPSLRLQEEGAFDAEENAACIAKIRAYLTQLPAAPLVLIKDPQITVLSGVWFEAARVAGLDIAAVIAVRHPQEVITSQAAASYRSFVSWLAGQDRAAAQAAWRKVFAGFDTPTLVGPPGRLGLGRRGVVSFEVSEQTTRALSELARSHHTTVSTVLQAAWVQLLMWLTGQHDVAFGTAVSGRPAEVTGSDSMVGLLINTVPVRASITPATTIADLLDQLQSAHNDTLEHQHLALAEIHRVAGHDQLFDTLFVYENYPVDTAALAGDHELAITEIAAREYNHYPLSVQAQLDRELSVRVEYDTDVFDAASVEALTGRFKRVLVAMTADSGQQS